MALCFTTGKLIPVLVLAAFVLESASGSPERRERHVSSADPTSQRLQSSSDFSSRTIAKSTFASNEFTSEPRRRVTHRLMGGHIKAETKTERPETFDDDDEATWDDGLILSSAGNGKEKKNSRTEDDDEKKTLSQQVKEGKYGLIQNEIYPTKPKRPGIISYLSNPEVPKDNAKNLGGLDEEEIWLAENHVLVLRGGNFPDHQEADNPIGGSSDDWSPIDDYKAPKRQVKIPPRPKVPPPFPVQLSENGPVQIIGVNGTRVDESSSDYETDTSSSKGFLPGEGPFFASSRNGTVADQDSTTKESNVKDRRTKSGRVPPPTGVIGPFYPALPPGAVFVVPPGNQSDYDEDDQSIYYPPPYSFTYKQDNSTPVPPGPLVPGIILPPPPDFFSGVEEKKPTTKLHMKYTKRPVTTPPPRVSPTYYPPRKSSAKPYKNPNGSSSSSSSSTTSTTKQTAHSTFTMKPAGRIRYKTTTGRSSLKPIRVQESVLPDVEVTTPSTSKASTLEISEYYTARPNTIANHAPEKTTTRSKSRWTSNVSSKPVPLVTYYSSSTPSTVDEPVETTPASIKSIITTRKQPTPGNQASYYFYEESNENAGTTPNPTIYYRATTEAPFYRLEDISQRGEQTKKSYYDARPTASQQTAKDYGVELIEPVSKTSSRYQYANSAPTANSVVSPRVQGQRMLAASAPIFYEPITERPQARRYYTTTKPRSYQREQQVDNRYDYEQAPKPKPIYQYSFEATDYAKRGQAQPYYKPESQRQSYYKQDSQQPTEAPEPFDEWQDTREDSQQQYDYESGEASPEQQIAPERLSDRYRSRIPVVAYPSSTSRPIIDTTPNPHHAYYTKQDEQLLDDVTKEYFTNFGKKLRGERLPSTTPIYAKPSVTERPVYRHEVNSYVSNDYEGNEREAATYKSPRVNVHYGDHHTQRPYSLEGDTRVNYKDPRPQVNPDSEWIPGFNPKERVNVQLSNYRTQQTQLENQDYVQHNLADQRLSPVRGYGGHRIVQQTAGSPTHFVPIAGTREEARRNYPTRPVSLAGDISVNYRDPRPPINPDAEFIDPVRDNGGDKASYFAYRLPGDGGHFYFLTPQAISQRQDRNGGYLYPRPRGTRLSRLRRRRSENA